MQMTNEVRAALRVLRDAAENDFERHRIDVLERDLMSPPVAEQVDEKHQSFNGVTFLKQKQGHYYCSHGIHVAVWLYYHGELPSKDCVVHHIDENPANNAIDNLQLMTRAEHGRRHPPVNTAPETRKMIQHTCSVCGKTYENIDPRSKFCSRSCMYKAHRARMMVPHTCVVCGREFIADKRFHIQCCSPHCAAILSWQTRKGDNNGSTSNSDK